MSDEPEQPEPAAEESETDESIRTSLQQAQQFHVMMDRAKEWSREAAMNLTIEAALADDEDAERLEEAVSFVRTVADRIEEGDTGRARRP